MPGADIKIVLRRYRGTLAGGIAIIVFILLRIKPQWAEISYGQFFYPTVRTLLDFSVGLLPFPAVYGVPVLIGFLIWRHFRVRKPILHRLRSGLNFIGWTVALFYVLWGFNYARPDLGSRIDQQNSSISDSLLSAFGEQTVETLSTLRTAHLMDRIASDADNETNLRIAVQRSVARYGIDLNTHSRVRLLNPPGILRKLGIAGIYFPFTGEGLLEESHPQPEKIFIMAHELAHSYGVTDEGDANLIAYIACTSHPERLYQYAGHLAMWEYLRGSLYRRNSVEIADLDACLSELVKVDLAVLKAERNKFEEWVPQMGDRFNDTYLKAQGVDAGIEAYSFLPERYLRHKKWLTARAP